MGEHKKFSLFYFFLPGLLINIVEIIHMKVIIAGSRGFSDFQLLYAKCEEVLANFDKVEIVSGTARGADKLGEHYASLKGHSVIQFPADWDKHGAKSGMIRNKEMAIYADVLICFWNYKSKGSQNMIEVAKELNLKVYVIDIREKNTHSNKSNSLF
jgi:hypothetical protein